MAKDRESSHEEELNDSDVAKPASSTKRKSTIDELEVDLTAPEPPSKRARRALKKGKALPKKADIDEEGDDDLTRDNLDEEGADKDGKGKSGKKDRSEHSVWVGNLPFTVTALQLRTWLVENSGGVITAEGITRIKIPTVKEPGRDKSAGPPANKGFAYVDFADLGGKVAAIALSENGLGGRKLLIKDATSFEGRPKKEELQSDAIDPSAPAGTTNGNGKLLHQNDAFKKEHNASRKIFVGNLSFKTTEDDLRRNFEKCGEIEFIKVATFEDTGKCKGFAWVRFKEPEAAAWAVKGFIKIKEAVETEDDFRPDEDKDDNEEPQQQRQYKTRKWWVNRMLGRELKLELAEDDHVRYKKRFGKGAQTDAKGKKDRETVGDAAVGARDRSSNNSQVSSSSNLRGADDIQVARLTGAMVKPTGTKTTFDD